MEFPRLLKKYHVEIPGVHSKWSGICRGVQEKIMLNFRDSWFLALEFPRSVTQFYDICKGKALFGPEFSRVNRPT